MRKRAVHALLEATAEELGGDRLHLTSTDFETAVFEAAKKALVARMQDKLRVSGNEFVVEHHEKELPALADTENERVVFLHMKCVPHRYAAEAALSPMSKAGTFIEIVPVTLKRLSRGAIAAYLDPLQASSSGPHVLQPGSESWASHAPLHLLEAAGLTQVEALGLTAHQVYLGNMDPTDEFALANVPALFGKDYLERIRGVSTLLKRTGIPPQSTFLAFHYASNEDSHAMRKLRAVYPEGIVLATKEDMTRDASSRQIWLAKNQRTWKRGCLSNPSEADPVIAARMTQVYLECQLKLDEPLDIEQTLRELSALSQSAPLLVKAMFRGELQTVRLKLVNMPDIRFIRSAPQAGSQERNAQEIIDLLTAYGVRTQRLQEPATA